MIVQTIIGDFSLERAKQLSEAYKKATQRRFGEFPLFTFTFEGQLMDVEFARYLLEYLETKFGEL